MYFRFILYCSQPTVIKNTHIHLIWPLLRLESYYQKLVEWIVEKGHDKFAGPIVPSFVQILSKSFGSDTENCLLCQKCTVCILYMYYKTKIWEKNTLIRKIGNAILTQNNCAILKLYFQKAFNCDAWCQVSVWQSAAK